MANKYLHAGRLLTVLVLVLCFGFFSISGSASQIDLVDREDFVVDIQLTTYSVRHQYYTDGNLDGTVSDGFASDDGHSGMDAIVGGISKLTSYGGNSYRYSYYTVDSGSKVITLVYSRESAPAEPIATDPPATQSQVTEPPVTEPPATQPPETEPTKPEPTKPPATEPQPAREEPPEEDPPVEEVTVSVEEVPDATVPDTAQVIPDEEVPLAETPAAADAPKAEAPKENNPPVESPKTADAPKQQSTTEPWLFAARIGAIAVITLGAALLLFSFTKKIKK